MPDCQMCWNEWPTLTETPFPELAGIQVCRNCGRSMRQMVAFCRNHGVDLISVPQVGLNSGITEEGFKQSLDEAAKRVGEEEPPSPPAKKPAKAR